MRFRWSRDAGRDRDDIFDYIAADSLGAAAANDEKIAAIEVQLSHFPQSGRIGRAPGTREWLVSGTPYIAIYRLDGDELLILRVLHGAQRWPPQDRV